MPFIIGTPSDSPSNWPYISTVIAAQKDLSGKWLNSDGSVTINTGTNVVANTYYVDFSDLALQSRWPALHCGLLRDDGRPVQYDV